MTIEPEAWPFDPDEFVTALELRDACRGSTDAEVRNAVEELEAGGR